MTVHSSNIGHLASSTSQMAAFKSMSSRTMATRRQPSNMNARNPNQNACYGDLLPQSYLNERKPLLSSMLSPSLAAPSPSAAARSSRERVLHSLFSPPIAASIKSQIMNPYPPDVVERTSAPDQSFHTVTGRSLHFSPAHTAISSLGSPNNNNTSNSNNQNNNMIHPKIQSDNQYLYSNALDVKNLGLDSIQKCTSPEQIQQIIHFLQERGSFPGLISIAMRKLQTLANLESVEEQQYGEEDDASTLVMSLSTDVLNETVPSASIPTAPNTLYPNTSSPIPSEIIKLRQQIEDMRDNHANEQATFLERVQTLERAKNQAEAQLATISGMKTSRAQVLQSLRQIQGENRLLQRELENERVRRRQQENELANMERELDNKSRQLQEHFQNGALQTSTKVTELNALLRSAQANLERVREERDAFILSLMKASGKTLRQVKKMTRSDRESAVESFIAECLSTRSAVEALSASLSTSEKERLIATRDKNKAESRISELSAAHHKLIQENEELVKRICSMDDELKATRTVSDKLMASDTEKQAWEAERVMYNRVIKGLRKRLAQNDKMVPYDLYKAAVGEAKALRASTVGHMPADHPTTKQPRSNATPVPPKTPLLQSKIHVDPVGENVDSSAVRPRRVVFADQAHDDKVSRSTPETAQKKVSFCSPGNAGAGGSRRDIVRAVGGRFALKEKIDQLRSPRTPRPLATHN